jgi:TetR/AcrR family transcriptional repressor of nem operon
MEQTTRERLVEAARKLFYENGYAATGVSAILKEAGVRSGSMYHFFNSKEELLEAVLETYLGLLRPVVMDPVEAKTEDPIERVFTLLEQYRDFLDVTHCSGGCPIGNLALEVSDTHVAVREKIDQNFANWYRVVQGWLEAAGDRLPADVDREALAQYVLVVMEGGIMLVKAQRSLTPFDTAVAQLRDHFQRLVKTAERERNS